MFLKIPQTVPTMSNINLKVEQLFNTYNQAKMIEQNVDTSLHWNTFNQFSKQAAVDFQNIFVNASSPSNNVNNGAQVEYELDILNQLFSANNINHSIQAETATTTQNPSNFNNDLSNLNNSTDVKMNPVISEDILDDLASRFVLNMPIEEKDDPIRICFQIEIAFWFYVDFYCATYPELPKMKLKSFAKLMFNHIPRLRKFLSEFDQVISNWLGYKFSIPCSGAILLDKSLDNVLLVQGFGSKNWSFPKGKVNHDETLMNCAIREVLEETGYDCSGKIFEDVYLEKKILDSTVRLFVVTDVEMDFNFIPHVRNEIRLIEWFPIQHLPERNQKGVHSANYFSKLFTVIPFISSIRKWIECERKKKRLLAKKRQRELRRRKSSNETNETDDSQPISVSGDDNNTSTTFNFQSNSTSTSPFEEKKASESTSFVDVKLDDILDLSYTSYGTPNRSDLMSVYNVDDVMGNRRYQNGSVQSNSPNTTGNETNWSSTWQSLVNEYNRLNTSQISNNQQQTGCNSPKSTNTTSTSLKTLSGIENGDIQQNGHSVKPETISSGSPLSIPISKLASKSTCDEKLNLLFGLAQNTISVNCIESTSYKENFNSLNDFFASANKNGTSSTTTNVNEVFNSNLFAASTSKQSDDVPNGVQSPFGTIGSGTCHSNMANTADIQSIVKRNKTSSPLLIDKQNMLSHNERSVTASTINGQQVPESSNLFLPNTSLKTNGTFNTTNSSHPENINKFANRYNGLNDTVLPDIEVKIQSLLQRLKFLNSN